MVDGRRPQGKLLVTSISQLIRQGFGDNVTKAFVCGYLVRAWKPLPDVADMFSG
jgi:hypothetical protein